MDVGTLAAPRDASHLEASRNLIGSDYDMDGAARSLDSPSEAERGELARRSEGTDSEESEESEEEGAGSEGGGGACSSSDTAQVVEERKQSGNAAFGAGNVRDAVDHWTAALKLLMKNKCSSMPEVERTLYLNLALGHLKLHEPRKALRATQCVLHGDPLVPKALYRATEACMQLEDYSRAEIYLNPLEACDSTLHAALKRKLHVERKQAADAQRTVQKRMFRATEGISEEKPPPGAGNTNEAAMPTSCAMLYGLSTEVAEKAKQLHKERERQGNDAAANNCYGGGVAGISNEEARAQAFMEKALAKTRKYTAASKQYMARKELIAERSRIRYKVRGHDFLDKRDMAEREMAEGEMAEGEMGET
eukprot:GEMP01064203.1.p1 GENE.GEMP01064203.1~~GEMP01064203.1.p1  ORF type:complete len:364 (+),score=141.82 GEMP01064203.1:85-1176(+)